MLFTIGYVLAGAILYKALTKDEKSVVSSSDYDTSSYGNSETSFKVKEGIGVLKLSSCNLIAVQLGPSENKKRAVLTIYLESKITPHEKFKQVSVLNTKNYVKLFPTYYVTGITLESEGVPITAYYSSVF